jgi:hypothetical protein
MGDLRNQWWQNVISAVGLITILATCYQHEYSSRLVILQGAGPALPRSAERGPAVVHTLEIDVTVPRARSTNRGVYVERVDNLSGLWMSTWSAKGRLGRAVPDTRPPVLSHTGLGVAGSPSRPHRPLRRGAGCVG